MVSLVAKFNKLAEQPYDGTASLQDGDAVAHRMKLITEEYVELVEASRAALIDDTPENRAHVLKEIIDLLYVTLGMGVVFYKRDVCRDAFEIVHTNNLDKLRDGIIKDEDGKVLKPEGWKPVDLRELVADD